jgi:predicted nucleic acid-binding protein
MEANFIMTLVDTNIFIELFKGNTEVLQRIQMLGPENIGLSAITEMELYCGALNKLELQRIKKHIRAFQLFHITQEVSERSSLLVARYAKSHGLQIPDAIIAATALEHLSPLFTLNTKDFRFIDGIQLV